MKNTFMASVAALAMITVPGAASAQQTGQPTGTGTAMQQDAPANPATATPEQQRSINALPADRRQSYDTMTPEMQSYYRGLDAQRQDAWWLLTPEQRTQLYGLQPAQRDAAWASILQQVATANAGTPQGGAGTTGDPMGDGTQAGTPPAQGTMADDAGMNPPMTPPTTPPMAGDMATSSSTTTGMGMDAGNIRFVSSERVQAVAADSAPTTGDVPICRAGQEDNCINRFEATGRGNRPLDSYPGERRTTTPRQ